MNEKNAFLSVSLVQFDLAWEDPEQNRSKLGELFTALPAGTDLVVLPELFSTGFSMNAGRLAEPMHGPTVKWMQQQARQIGAVIAGSLIIHERHFLFNRFIFAFPDGGVDFYDKRHLFAIGGENQAFTPGSARKIISVKGFRILPQICYDLRFPVFSRNRSDYDVLVNCANWPASRNDVWTCLTRARAIENQVYVLAANRIGTDGQAIGYEGHSLIIDPQGTTIAQAGTSQNICSAIWTMEALTSFRSKFPVLPDADQFELKL